MPLSAFGALLQGLSMGYQQAKAWQEQEKQRRIQELLANLQLRRFEEVEKPESQMNLRLGDISGQTAEYNLGLLKEIQDYYKSQGWGPGGVGLQGKLTLANIGQIGAATEGQTLENQKNREIAAYFANHPQLALIGPYGVNVPVMQGLADIAATEAATEATKQETGQRAATWNWWEGQGYGPGGVRLSLDQALANIAAIQAGTKATETETAQKQGLWDWWQGQNYGPMGAGLTLREALANIAATEAGTGYTQAQTDYLTKRGPLELAILGAEAENAPLLYRNQAEAAGIPVQQWDIARPYYGESLRLGNLLTAEQIEAARAGTAQTQAQTDYLVRSTPLELAILGAQAEAAPRLYQGQAEAAWVPVEQWGIAKPYYGENLRLSNALLGSQTEQAALDLALNRDFSRAERETGLEFAREQVTGQKTANEAAAFELGLRREHEPALYGQKVRLGELEIDAQEIANSINRVKLGIASEFDYKVAELAYQRAQEEYNQLVTTGEFIRPSLQLDLDTRREQLNQLLTEGEYLKPRLQLELATGQENLAQLQTRGKYLEPQLQLDLETGQFQLGHAKELAPHEVASAAAGAREANVAADIAEATKEDVIGTTKAQRRVAESEAAVAEATESYRIRQAEAGARLAEGQADEQDLRLQFLPESLKRDLAIKAADERIALDEAITREKTRDARIQQAITAADMAVAELKNLTAKVTSGQTITDKDLLDFGMTAWKALYGDPLAQVSGQPVPSPQQFAYEFAGELRAALSGETPVTWLSGEQQAANAGQAVEYFLTDEKYKGDPTLARQAWLAASGEQRKAFADSFKTTEEAITLELNSRANKPLGARAASWISNVWKRITGRK